MSKLSVKIESFMPRRSNSMLGVLDIDIPEIRLRIRGATVHESHGRRWVGLPGKPQIDRDGQVKRDGRGKALYTPVLQFLDRDVSDAFSQRVIAELIERFLHVFDEGAS